MFDFRFRVQFKATLLCQEVDDKAGQQQRLRPGMTNTYRSTCNTKPFGKTLSSGGRTAVSMTAGGNGEASVGSECVRNGERAGGEHPLTQKRHSSVRSARVNMQLNKGDFVEQQMWCEESVAAAENDLQNHEEEL